MYSIVLDTNVVISALRSRRGASFAILRQIGEAWVPLISVPLILEYEAVGKREAGRGVRARVQADGRPVRVPRDQAEGRRAGPGDRDGEHSRAAARVRTRVSAAHRPQLRLERGYHGGSGARAEGRTGRRRLPGRRVRHARGHGRGAAPPEI